MKISGGSKKGRGGLREAMDTALQPGAHSKAHPTEERNPIVVGDPSSQKEQRDSVGIPAGVSNMSSG